jgi:hypothetical protein
MAARPISILMIFHPMGTIERMEQLSSRLNSLEVPLLEIGAFISDFMAFNFLRAPWPALRETTIQRKRAMGFPIDSLVRTGAMKDAATGARWSAGRLGGGSFMATLEVPGYSKWHWEGTRFMPERDFALIPEEAGSKMVDIIEEYLNSA